MNYDNIEEYIIQNKEGFDDLIPSNDLFSKIKTKKKTTKTIILKRFFQGAAAILLLSIGIFALNQVASFTMDSIQSSENRIDSTYQEFYEMESYYSQQIAIVMQEIISLYILDDQGQQEIQIELAELNQLFPDLSGDLEDQTNDTAVIEAIIMNYRVKLKMLEDMKTQLQPILTLNKEVENEKMDS